MPFPWESLIAAAAGVIGGIGGAGVTGYLANKREEAAADRTAIDADTDRQRDAYVALLVTSRAALRNFQQLRIAYWADTPDIREVREAVGHASAFATELSRDVAVVELLGSGETCNAARELFAKNRKCADMYQARSIGLAMAQDAPDFTPSPFDADQAQALCADLDAAINAFAHAARHAISDEA
jgi:hypothetical protein